MDADKLRKLAKAAVSGPWQQSHRKIPDESGYSTEVYDSVGETIATLAWYPVNHGGGHISTAREANAAYIAACDPQTIFAILDDNDAMRAALRTMVYETTHLSAQRDDGAHDCRISAAALAQARAVLAPKEPGA